MGSKTMLKMAPDSRTALENLGLPSDRMRWAMDVEKMPKGTPQGDDEGIGLGIDHHGLGGAEEIEHGL